MLLSPHVLLCPHASDNQNEKVTHTLPFKLKEKSKVPTIVRISARPSNHSNNKFINYNLGKQLGKRGSVLGLSRSTRLRERGLGARLRYGWAGKDERGLIATTNNND